MRYRNSAKILGRKRKKMELFEFEGWYAPGMVEMNEGLVMSEGLRVWIRWIRGKAGVDVKVLI